MAQHKIGDVVMLKSGGPIMTVSKVMDDARVYCEWFDGNNTPQGRTFPAETVEPYRSDGGVYRG